MAMYENYRVVKELMPDGTYMYTEFDGNKTAVYSQDAWNDYQKEIYDIRKATQDFFDKNVTIETLDVKDIFKNKEFDPYKDRLCDDD